MFLAVQTVFEGYKANTFDRGKEVLAKFKLDIPLGQDGMPGVRSTVMRDFKTRGTPWTIIIDPEGMIRASTFHIPSAEAIKVIDGFKNRERLEKQEKLIETLKEQQSKKPAEKKTDRPNQ